MRSPNLRALTALLLGACLLFVGCDSQLTAPNSDEAQPQTPSQATANAGGPGGPAVPGPACDATVSSGSSIQAAVDAASSGDKVCVESGTFTEQVLINKDLTLQGLNDPTIEMPSDPSGFLFPESGLEWEPVVFAFGGSKSGSDVSGSGTVDVSVSGFHIDGADLQPDNDKGVRPRLAGILYRNVQSSGGVTENAVDGLANGGKENFGVGVYGDSDVTISSNTVTGYERIGIIVSGRFAPASTARVRNNTVTTSNPQGKNWAPNGIEFVDGAQGDAMNNTVKGNVHPSAASGGVLVVGTNGIKVKGNTIENNDYGVGVFTFFGDAPSANNSKVTQNEITDAKDWGVIVATFASGTTANNNKVINNTITGDAVPNDDDEGVFIWAALGPAENNKVIANTIIGFEDRVQDDGSESKVQANAKPATP